MSSFLQLLGACGGNFTSLPGKMRQKCKCLLHLVETALFIQSVEDAPLFHLLKTLWKVCKTCLLMGFSTVSTEFSTAVVEKFST